ncbi:ankyrin repeat and SOCS box protein 15 [Brachionichthys hirsutus]|uniref:ankyrin repeat and SOCS box protein 15 n=1 Tax=Brachionichthys hirsutus TaxID=412623 RepID=UPI0036044296
MDAADDEIDEDELQDYNLQMNIQESCQRSASRRSDAPTLLEAVRQASSILKNQHNISFVVASASFSLSLEEKTSGGETFLTLAVAAGLVENVKMLLDHGASPRSTNSQNESPLLLAVRAGSLQMASALVAGGAEVGQVCLKRWTAMHEASRAGCVPVMELLLENGGHVSQTDQHGVTPLGIAAEYSHPEVLELLLKHGADVNAQAPNGDSVLYDAAGSGNPDCINILLQHGANPNIRNLSFQLPVHHAAYEGHYLVLRILIPITTRRALRLSGHSPVHSAADGGHVHCLELLLQRGFDVNALLAPHISENYGDIRRSPLYFAVSNGDATCTEVLLRSGAKPDLDPLRCLLVAVRSGRYDIVELLLAAEADVNCYFTVVSDTVFPTALQYCLKDEAMMRLLLNNGYSADACFSCHHDDSWDDLSVAVYSQQLQGKVAFCDFVSVSWLQNLVGRVVSILLEYVGQVSLCSKLTRILERHKEWPHICRITHEPRSLCHLARVVIRKHLRCSDLVFVQLPNRLKDYLLFKEHDLYAKLICRED